MTTQAKPVLAPDTARRLIRDATLAPSGHNAQPWRFRVHGDEIAVLPDFWRQLPVVDHDNHALYISLGCALENLVIAAGAAELAAEVTYFRGDGTPDGVSVTLHRALGRDGDLHQAIPARQSTRSLYDGNAVPVEHLDILTAAAARDGVRLLVFTGRRDIEPLIASTKDACRLQYADRAFVTELVSWIRFNRREIALKGDGLTAAALGIPLPAVPRWLGSLAVRLAARPDGEAERVEEAIRSSSGLALFVAERDDPAGWLDLGRAFERWALTATTLGIKHAHVNMPCEVLEVRDQLRVALGLGTAQPLLLIRFGYGRPMPRSPRRPLDEVIVG